VDTSLWAIGGDGPGFEQSRELLQIFLYGVYCCRIYLEAKRWLNKERVSQLCRTSGDRRPASWTASDAPATRIGSNGGNGSRLFFWRWPVEWQQEARDGHPLRHFYMPPRSSPRARTLDNVNPWMKELVPVNLRKFLSRRYLLPLPFCTSRWTRQADRTFGMFGTRRPAASTIRFLPLSSSWHFVPTRSEWGLYGGLYRRRDVS
jgi:hypothetical protein